jgi:short-subunit dehydrogenase
MKLSGSHIVITGASRGIGAALARIVAERGARVTLLARSEAPLKALATQLGGLALPVDLTSPEELDGLVDRIESDAGPIEALVNNAAYAASGEFIDRSAQQLRTHILTNLVAPMELCRQLVPRMIDRGHGNLMTISSVGAELSTRNTACYSASKAGLNQFTLNLRRELRRAPITVSLAVLAGVDTDMLAEGRQDPVLAAVDRRLKLLGALNPDAVAVAVAGALETDRETLVMPKAVAPMYHLRQVPSRFADLLMYKID